MNHKRLKAGQTLVEFALLLPLFLLLVVGFFDIGRAVLYYTVLNNAVREGTRFAIVQPSASYGAYPTPDTIQNFACDTGAETAHRDICNEIKSYAFDIGELSGSDIIITHVDKGTPDPKINIQISFDYHPVTPGLGSITDFTIVAESEMLLAEIAKPED
jgi:hypothetical protein